MSSTVICGAGIAGVSAAYWLSKAGVKDVFLIDERSPLSLTSDKSTECYRNWWPDSELFALIDRSIDLIERFADDSGNVFHLNRRGYLFITSNENKISQDIKQSMRISSYGAGPVRIHTPERSSYQASPSADYQDQPTGADILLQPSLIQKHFPYITSKAVAALHVRRAGWLSAQQLGRYLLNQALEHGVEYICGKVTNVCVENGRINSTILASGERIVTSVFILAAGPFLKEVGELFGVDLPVYNELHYKVSFNDASGMIGRSAPLLIWDEAQKLPWTEEENKLLAADLETHWLIETLPSGVHTRPEGGSESKMVLMLWDYQKKVSQPIWPPKLDGMYPEIVLRGLTTMLPGLKRYIDRLPRPFLDGGYYTKTRENRPLIGPLPVTGAYVIGALSGFGIMAACAAGELLAAHVLGNQLPRYAPSFMLSRYKNKKYIRSIRRLVRNGQL